MGNRRCSQCGRDLKEGANFCLYCGAPVKQDGKQDSVFTPPIIQTGRKPPKPPKSPKSPKPPKSPDSPKHKRTKVPMLVGIFAVMIVIGALGLSKFLHLVSGGEGKQSSDAATVNLSGFSNITDTLNTPIETLASYYGDVVKSYQKQYGEVHIEESIDILDGVCLVKLLDFDNDGSEELLMVYENGEGAYSIGHYIFEIWSYNGSKAEMVDSGPLFVTYNVDNTLYLADYDDQYYVISGKIGTSTEYIYHGYIGPDYGVVHQAIDDPQGFGGEYRLDRVCTHQKTWEDDRDAWQGDCQQYPMGKDFSEEELQITKDIIALLTGTGQEEVG